MYLCLKVKNSMQFLVSIYNLPLGLRVKETVCTSLSENEKTRCTVGFRLKIFMQPPFNSDSVLFSSFALLCVVITTR
jgi:hypothetical protein